MTLSLVETGGNLLLKYGKIPIHHSLSETNKLHMRTSNLRQRFSETKSKMGHSAESRNQSVLGSTGSIYGNREILKMDSYEKQSLLMGLSNSE